MWEQEEQKLRLARPPCGRIPDDAAPREPMMDWPDAAAKYTSKAGWSRSPFCKVKLARARDIIYHACAPHPFTNVAQQECSCFKTEQSSRPVNKPERKCMAAGTSRTRDSQIRPPRTRWFFLDERVIDQRVSSSPA